MAIEAALEAEQMLEEGQAERRRVAELDLRQAAYDAVHAERRYTACDPDNRLIAAQLEKNWETALRRVEACRARHGKSTRKTSRRRALQRRSHARDVRVTNPHRSNGDEGVVEEQGEGGPAVEGVAHGFGEIALAGDPGLLVLAPCAECRDVWAAVLSGAWHGGGRGARR